MKRKESVQEYKPIQMMPAGDGMYALFRQDDGSCVGCRLVMWVLSEQEDGFRAVYGMTDISGFELFNGAEGSANFVAYVRLPHENRAFVPVVDQDFIPNP